MCQPIDVTARLPESALPSQQHPGAGNQLFALTLSAGLSNANDCTRKSTHRCSLSLSNFAGSSTNASFAMARTAQLMKNLQRFRLVTFDVTDTLLRVKVPPGQQYAATAREFGIRDVEEGQLEQYFRQEFKAMTSNHPNFGLSTPNMTWQDWWQQLVENIFCRVSDQIPEERRRQLAQKLVRMYRTRSCWAHMEGNQELLEKIHSIGKCIGVISNSDPSLLEVLREMELLHKFDFVLTSYDTGILKPHAGIFEIPLQLYNIAPHQALHIGNLYKVDYIGARNSGWCSLLVTTADDEPCDVTAPLIYSSLTELLNALETKDIDW